MAKRFIPFTVLLSACSLIPSVGPDYDVPANPAVAQWEMRTEDQKLFADAAEANVIWWRQLNDPLLETLISKAIASNPSYQIAASKLREARAITRESISSFLPSIDGSYSATRSDVSDNTPAGQLNAKPIDLYQAGFDAAWEIDIFGGNRRAYEAASAEEDSTRARYDDAGISLAAEVAKNYIELRSFERRLAIAQHNVDIQSQTRDLVKAKFDAGVSSELDLAQANAQLETTRSTIPTLQTEMKRRLYRLATLNGEAPQNFSVDLSTTKSSIPKFSSLIGVSQPSELLRTRPDVRAAERSLAAQTARVGVAIADIFPKVTITGNLGVQSTNSGSLFTSDSRFWSLGPSVTMPFFHGGAILANIDIQEERAKQALSNYEQTTLEALEDAQNSLNAYSYELDRVQSLQRSFEASQRALTLSNDLYRQGLIDFLRVLDAQRAVFAAEETLVVSQQQVAIAGIGIYKAFAGSLPPMESTPKT